MTIAADIFAGTVRIACARRRQNPGLRAQARLVFLERYKIGRAISCQAALTMLSRQTAIRCCYLVAFLVRNFKIKLQCLYVWIMLQFSTQSFSRLHSHLLLIAGFVCRWNVFPSV